MATPVLVFLIDGRSCCILHEVTAGDFFLDEPGHGEVFRLAASTWSSLRFVRVYQPDGTPAAYHGAPVYRSAAPAIGPAHGPTVPALHVPEGWRLAPGLFRAKGANDEAADVSGEPRRA